MLFKKETTNNEYYKDAHYYSSSFSCFFFVIEKIKGEKETYNIPSSLTLLEYFTIVFLGFKIFVVIIKPTPTDYYYFNNKDKI